MFPGLLQNVQPEGEADLIVGSAVLDQVLGVLVELTPVRAAHAVDHQVVVEAVGVHMSGHQHLVVRELTPRQLQPQGVDLLRREVVVR